MALHPASGYKSPSLRRGCPMDEHVATEIMNGDEAALRSLYEPPLELALLKQLDRLDGHCRNFLAHSPFAVIGSTRPGHGTDVSPRGDAPGFVRVLDDHTIAIPDRPGNNRLGYDVEHCCRRRGR